MNTAETLHWVTGLLPVEPHVEQRSVGASFPTFTVAEVFLPSDESVAFTLDASQIEPHLQTEDESDVRVEFVAVTTGHSDMAARLATAAATMVAENPVERTPQPGTLLPDLGRTVDDSLTAVHGLLVVPFLWAEQGVPQVHEVASGGRRAKDKQNGAAVEFTHPGRLTVPIQLLMLTDAEFALAQRDGVSALQAAMTQREINLNDVWRVQAEL